MSESTLTIVKPQEATWLERFPERTSVWFRNLKVLHVRIAYWILSRELQRDSSYHQSWQCNIAMPIYDHLRENGINDPALSNKIADRLMKHLFNA